MFAKLKALSAILRSKRSEKSPIISPVPKHVAVIMDGNGRWANSQGLTRVAGHKRGVDAVKGLIKSCLEYEIPVLSLFAFSSENWQRPESEVDALMELLAHALETQTKKLDENEICLRLLGDLSRFDYRIQELADGALSETANNQKLTLNVAINYGGRWDITHAMQAIGEKISAGDLEPQMIDEELIASHLSTFMLWQAAYSEFYFTDTLWPDFDADAFNEALLCYANRERRFGIANDLPEVDEKDVSKVAQKESARHA